MIEELTDRVVKLDANGKRVLAFSIGPPLANPVDPRRELGVDSIRRTMYVDAGSVPDFDFRGLHVRQRASGQSLKKYLLNGTNLGRLRLRSLIGMGHFTLGDNGDIYVADSSAFKVRKFSAAGKLLLQFGRPNKNGGPGQFGAPPDEGGPTDVAVDSKGDIYVLDYNDDVQIFDSSGRHITTWPSSWDPSEDSR